MNTYILGEQNPSVLRERDVRKACIHAGEGSRHTRAAFTSRYRDWCTGLSVPTGPVAWHTLEPEVETRSAKCIDVCVCQRGAAGAARRCTEGCRKHEGIPE